MRCRRAQKSIIPALDGALAPRARRAFDRHLAACSACRAEMALGERLAAALDGMPLEMEVPARVEQATLRRVRLAADMDEERRTFRRVWGWGFPVPALAAVVVLLVAVVVTLRSAVWLPSAPAPIVRSPGSAPTRVARADGDGRTGGRAATPRTLEDRVKPTGAVASAVPVAAPPPELARAPELFMNLPLLRNMDKLEHFDAILTTTVDDEDRGPGQEPQSNG